MIKCPHSDFIHLLNFVTWFSQKHEEFIAGSILLELAHDDLVLVIQILIFCFLQVILRRYSNLRGAGSS
jgi:hypothetical protein